MINKSQLIFFSPEDLIVLYLGFYNQEYGNKKGSDILSKIESSKKVKEFITKLRIENLTPGDDGFITVVNSIPYFLFSKGETLGYGTLYAIKLWIDQSSNDSFKLSYDAIHNIVVETIFRADRTKIHVSSNLSFFEKYFLLLRKVLENSLQNLSQSGNFDD